MSELNKIVTNFPMSLSQDENRNLALTLSAVLEGGGGGVANAIWKPAVDQDGLMTWSWDTFPDSARPPESVNIKGPRGESGAPGRDGTNGTNGTDGKDGVDGKTPQIQINSSNAHWEWRYSGASEWTDLGVVASGAVGPQGIPGVSGASGAPGAKGEDGDDGFSPAVTMSAITNPKHPNGGTRVTITDKTHPTGQYFDIFNGDDGSGSSDKFDPSTMSGYGTDAAPYGVDTTVMATQAWVGEQGYLTSVPDTYATKEYANDTSANALSQAQSWVGSQNFLTKADLSGYATETYVADSSAETLSQAKNWVEDNYLPTSGGTVSGQLEVHGGSNFDQQFLKLTREGVNGHGRVSLGTNGPLALKVDDANNHTTQVNISPNDSNDQLVQVQHNGNTVGNLIPAQIHQGTYTPTSADGILHIVLES